MLGFIGSHFQYVAMFAGGAFAVVMIYVSIEEAIHFRNK